MQRTPLRDVAASGAPLSEISASGMSHHQKASQIEVVVGCLLFKEAKSSADVLKGTRIAAAGLIGTTVLNVPNRDTISGQCTCDVAHLPDAFVFAQEAPAVHEHDHGERAAARGLEESNKLLRCCPVGKSGFRFRAPKSHVFIEGHRMRCRQYRFRNQSREQRAAQHSKRVSHSFGSSAARGVNHLYQIATQKTPMFQTRNPGSDDFA